MKQVPQPYIIRLAATLISVFLMVLAFYYLKIVLVPLLFAIIFTVMIFPFCLRLEKWGVPKGVASFISVFLFTIVVALLAYIIYVQLSIFVDHIPETSAKLNSAINDVRDFAAHKFSMKKSEVGNRIQEGLTALQNSSISAGSLNVLSSLLINIFLIPMYIFFLMYYRHFFIEFFYKLFHAAERELIDETLSKMSLVIRLSIWSITGHRYHRRS
jgi:predicted PurR-regulated permease PerM